MADNTVIKLAQAIVSARPTDSFQLLAFTPPQPCTNEGIIIEQLIEVGFNRVHLRHPGASKETIIKILDDINPMYYSKITLHSHPQIALAEPSLGFGINLKPSAMPYNEDMKGAVKSFSCHSVADIEAVHTLMSEADYCFLSPVFNSISKPGYNANIAFDDNLRHTLTSVPTIALGGASGNKLNLLADIGFAGAAVLGALQYH